MVTSPRLPVVLATAILWLAAGPGYASDRKPDPAPVPADGVLRACADKHGDLRLVESHDECRRSETPVFWSVQGPQGPQGVPGIPGQPGVIQAFCQPLRAASVPRVEQDHA